MTENSKKYKDLFDKLDTLDIILFNGNNYWYSYVVEYFTWSNFSHVGIVLKSPTYISPELTGVYLLESGFEAFPDAEDHQLKFGVQISDLGKVLTNYTGRAYYRKLIKRDDKINSINNKENEAKLCEIYQSVYDKPYDDLISDLARAEIQWNVGNCQYDKKFFCSALVAYVYSKLGLLPENLAWSLVIPKYFGPKQKLEPELIDAKLGELIQIS